MPIFLPIFPTILLSCSKEGKTLSSKNGREISLLFLLVFGVFLVENADISDYPAQDGVANRSHTIGMPSYGFARPA